MSSKRVGLLCAVAALVLAAGSHAVGAAGLPQADGGRPRQAGPGPVEQRANPITPDNPIPRRLYFVAPYYPAEAAAVDARGAVTLRVTVDELGRVAEVRHTSVLPFRAADGPALPASFPAPEAAMAKAAEHALRQWQYEPPANGPIAFDVTFSFDPDVESQVLSHGGASFGYIAGPATERLAPAVPERPPPPGPVPAWAAGVTRVGGAVRPPVRVRHTRPVYPPRARAAGAHGVVVLEARVEPDGRVIHARVVRSVPLLDRAALDAVTRWEFAPPLVDGVPAPLIMMVTVQFAP